MNRLPSHSKSSISLASLGGKVLRYGNKQNIYSQDTPASTLFYIQSGGVRLTTRSKDRPPAVTAILGTGDFFGELCLVGLPLRMSTAVALTASSIRVIKKSSMIRLLGKKNEISNSFVSYLITSIRKYQDHVSELLTCSAEQRLAHVLLRLSQLGKKRGPSTKAIPALTDQMLAEMVGTTRSRINLFMNRFEKLGFISYNGEMKVHKSLKDVLKSGQTRGATPADDN